MEKYIINKIFESLDGTNQIEVSIIDNIGWFNINKLDPINYKTFLYLLKDVIEFYNQNKVLYIKQYINKDSIEFFKNSTYIEIDENTVTINTPIIYFIKDIVDALGIQPL